MRKTYTITSLIADVNYDTEFEIRSEWHWHHWTKIWTDTL